MSPRQPPEPGARRIGAPLGLLLAVAVDRLAQPALRIFGLDQPDRAEIAARDASPRLRHQRVAAIGEGEAVELAAARHRRLDGQRLGQVQRHRLFGEDVEAGVERGDRRRRMEMIGGDDREHFHALVLGQRGLRRQQRFERRIGARGIEAQRLGAPAVAGGVAAERTADQLVIAVERRRHAMHRADESALAAADHAIANSRLCARRHLSHPLPLMRLGPPHVILSDK